MAGDRPYRRLRSGRGARGEKGEGRGRKKRGGLLVFLIASVAPLGAIGWYVAQPAEKKAALHEKIHASSIGGRLLSAGIAFGILLLLSLVALPAFHNASKSLRAGLEKLRGLPVGLRILAFPAEFLLWLVWFLSQLLFAVDAFLIIAVALVGLLLVVRILMPGFLPDVLPQFADPGAATP